ncbi:MAG TPA: hypothetical protein VNG53_11795, partial [Bacteroidia bacterium]|nr:hypothetical protein [Bacteroidia bacterium]
NHGYIYNRTLSGESFYGDFWITKKIGVFARYDMLTSNKVTSSSTDNWDAPSDGSIIIAGLECKPVKGVALSLNYQGWTPYLSTGAHVNSIYTSLQYAF